MGRSKSPFHLDEVVNIQTAVVGEENSKYPSIVAACATEDAGAVINIRNGTYVEIADLVLKTGQKLIGESVNGVIIELGDNIISIASVSVITVENITFKFEAVTDEFKVQLDSSTQFINFKNCVFDFSASVNPHKGIEDAGCQNSFESILITNSTVSTTPLHVDGCLYGRYEKICINFGDASTTHFIDVDDAYGCLFDDIIVNNLDDGANTKYAIYEHNSGGADRNTFRNIDIDPVSPVLNGMRIGNAGTIVDGIKCLNCYNSMVIDEWFVKVSNFDIKSSTKIGIKVNSGEGIEIVNGHVLGGVAGETGIEIVSSNNGKISNVDLSGNTVLDLLIDNPSYNWTITNLKCDMIEIDAPTITFVNCSFGNTVDIESNALDTELIGCNYLPAYFTDGGVGTKFGMNIHIDTVAPTGTDDKLKGYKVGHDFWYDNVSFKFYKCDGADNDAAVWTEIGGGGSGDISLGELTTPNGGAVVSGYQYDNGGGNSETNWYLPVGVEGDFVWFLHLIPDVHAIVWPQAAEQIQGCDVGYGIRCLDIWSRTGLKFTGGLWVPLPGYAIWAPYEP